MSRQIHSPGATTAGPPAPASAPETSRSRLPAGSVPWAAWPNVLSLDAPAVALVWQALFTLAHDNRLPRGPEALALGLAVWLIYVGDRLLDARRLDLRRPHLLRHRLHAGWARGFAAAWALGFVAAALVAGRWLDPALARSGLVVAAGVLLYAVGVHAGGGTGRGAAKELQVGLLFAVGVSLACWHRDADLSLLLGSVLAGLLFTANCLLVTGREAEAQPDHDRPAADPRALARRIRWLLAAVVGGSTLGALTGKVPLALAAPLVAGSLALGLLRGARCPAGTPLRRVDRQTPTRVDPGGLLVDASLLGPPLLAAWLLAAWSAA